MKERRCMLILHFMLTAQTFSATSALLILNIYPSTFSFTQAVPPCKYKSLVKLKFGRKFGECFWIHFCCDVKEPGWSKFSITLTPSGSLLNKYRALRGARKWSTLGKKYIFELFLYILFAAESQMRLSGETCIAFLPWFVLKCPYLLINLETDSKITQTPTSKTK